MATKAYKNHMQKMVEYGCMVCRHFENVEDPPPCNIHHIRDKTGLGIKDKDMIYYCIVYKRYNIMQYCLDAQCELNFNHCHKLKHGQSYLIDYLKYINVKDVNNYYNHLITVDKYIIPLINT